MTPTELRALLFLALVAVVGAGARLARAPAAAVAEPAQRRALAAQLAAVDSVRRLDESGGGRRRVTSEAANTSSSRQPRRRRGARDGGASETATAVGPTFPIDVDLADSAALDALPGIGPALARRIVEERGKCGPYGSLRALERVRGIGPALSKRLAEKVTFSQSPRPFDAVDGCGDGPRTRSRARRAGDRS